MPKRSGSNKLQRSRKSGPRRSKHAPSPQPQDAKKASSTPSPPKSTKDLENEPEPSSAKISRSEDTDESTKEPVAIQPSGVTALLNRFNELPITTRYIVIGSVVALVLGLAYFALNRTPSSSGSSPTAPSADLSPPVQIVLPSGMLSVSPSPKPPTTSQPPAATNSSSSVPKAEDPAKRSKPAPQPSQQGKPAPAPQKGGADNPY